jgi:acyl-CoA thioesterase-2
MRFSRMYPITVSCGPRCKPHGIRMDDPRLQIASLDHSIWFHRQLRMDDWLLFAMESPNASGGRGLCFAHIYNRDAVLMASATQEGLIRFAG